jgi:hypothetical protein
LTHDRRDRDRVIAGLGVAAERRTAPAGTDPAPLVEREIELINDGPADFRAQFRDGGDCMALRVLQQGKWGL